MSATNRGSDRIESDYYPTPAWCVHRLLEAQPFRPSMLTSRDSRWLEPMAGEGAIIRGLRAAGVVGSIRAIDIRDCREDQLRSGATIATMGDVANTHESVFGTHDHWDVIITNPAFSCAEDAIQNLLPHCQYGAFLVRQGFVGHSRASWMRDNMPDSYELPDRPEFVASLKCVGVKPAKRNGGTKADSCGWHVIQQLDAPRPKECPTCQGRVQVTTSDAADYCWLVWTPERGRKRGERVILADTPPELRKVIPRAA